MEHDYEKELRNFAAVWKRVQKSRNSKPELELMPRWKNCNKKPRK